MGEGLLPSTFETRGIALPLTTPFFAFARLRRIFSGLALTLPSVEKPGHSYQIPLDELASAASLTVFDRALLEELAGLHDPRPDDVREYVTQTELTGLRGAKPMRRRRAEQNGGTGEVSITGTSPDSLGALLAAMGGLADDLRRWLIHEPIDAAELAQRTSLALRKTVKLAEPKLDRLAGAPEEEAAGLHEEIIYLTDGWPRILQRWEKSLKGEFYLQRETLMGFFPFLPLLPADLAASDLAFWEGLAKVQLRWLRRSPLIEELSQDTKTILSRNMKPLD